MKRHTSSALWFTALALTAALVFETRAPTAPPTPRVVPPDLSGLAWIKGDSFLAVHDAKAPGLPRLSVVHEPQSADAPLVRPLKIKGLDDEPFDLESIARVPPKFGTPADAPPSFLIAESGSNPRFRRLFHAVYQDGAEISLRQVGDLPQIRGEIEGLALFRTGSRLLLFLADRAEGEKSTVIQGFAISLDGEPRDPPGTEFFRIFLPDAGPRRRMISALEFDRDGNLYLASAVDPGVDTGPYRSEVWRIGWVRAKGAYVTIEPEKQGENGSPVRVATVDGMKVESLAFREVKPGVSELFFGTDDEFYGGALRTLGVLPR